MREWGLFIAVAVLEAVGSVLVFIGVWLESRPEKYKPLASLDHPLFHKVEKFARLGMRLVVIGVGLEAGGVAGALYESYGATKDAGRMRLRAALFESNNLVLKTNLSGLQNETEQLRKSNLELEKATRQLVHQYDQSTNALAEANARLAAIRPIKERLVEFMKELDPWIMSFLKAGETNFEHGSLSPYKYNKLMSLADEPGASAYIHSIRVVENSAMLIEPAGQKFAVKWCLTPALAQ